MTIKDFTGKWLFAFEDREQKKEFENEMKQDIKEIVQYYVEQALKAAAKEATCYGSEQNILNSYPLKNIK